MEQVKNILILSTSNPYRTAGVVAYDLYNGLKSSNYNVKLVVENYAEYEDGIVSVQSFIEYYFKVFNRKIKNLIKKRIFKFLFDDTRDYADPNYHFDPLEIMNQSYPTKKILKKAGFRPDVIIVIFAQYFISYKNLFELQSLTNAKILWQLADMNPFTGGCHYSWECKGYKTDCKDCPAIINSNYSQLPKQILSDKIKYNNDLDLTAVIGSDWLIKRAEQSILFKDKKIAKIYLSLDSSIFKPYDNSTINEIRKKYSLDTDKYIILVMANFLSHKRKGVDIILDALSLISEDYIQRHNLHLIIIGHQIDTIKNKIPTSFSYTHIDSVDRRTLPDIYNITDLFVSASLQDVGPYTITESLLCSTPVAALGHGYANEFIINDETGVLIDDDTPQSLKKGIMKMIETDENELEKLKDNCRERTKKIVSKEKQITEYIQLIDGIKNEN
jgi:glycosyltransferase involved in cell wall biosynthesis